MKVCEGKYYDQKRSKGICVAHGCSNFGEKDKSRKHPRKFCSKHRHQYNKENHLCLITYQNLKWSAKKRDKGFNLSYADFEKWCMDNNYLERKGRATGSMTIDRIKQDVGYQIGNIQLKEHNSNIRKYYIDTWLEKKYGPTGATRKQEYDECDWSEVEWVDGEPVRKDRPAYEIEDLPF